MTSIQYQLNSHPDFEIYIKNNPIYLIKVIHNIMHDSVITQHPFVSTTDDLNRITNVKQFETESLLDYVV